MKTLAALLALTLAAPAVAQPKKPAAPPREDVDLVLTLKVVSSDGNLQAAVRVQAQSQASTTVRREGATLAFNAVPVVNPNNGRIRMEYKVSAKWGSKLGAEADVQSASELELGQEATIYDAQGVVMRLVAVRAD